MRISGIIIEHNPLHNGHLYHINKTREDSGCDILIGVMSGNFVQRGEPAILDINARTELALKAGVDILVLLPYFYAVGNADTFAKGAIGILAKMGVDTLYFGSESADRELLESIASLIDTVEFNSLVKTFLITGESYAFSCDKAISLLLGNNATINANDILGIQYIRNIKQLNSKMDFRLIKRIHNNYNDSSFNHQSFASATSIRKAIYNHQDVTSFVPEITNEALRKNRIVSWDDFYDNLLYQIHVNKNNLNNILDVTEGIENRIYREAQKLLPLSEFITNLTSKRYTESHIKRILTHILNNITKSDVSDFRTGPKFIRILGFNANAKSYVRELSKAIRIPLITNVTRQNYHFVELEERVNSVYFMKTNGNTRFIPIILSY